MPPALVAPMLVLHWLRTFLTVEETMVDFTNERRQVGAEVVVRW